MFRILVDKPINNSDCVSLGFDGSSRSILGFLNSYLGVNKPGVPQHSYWIIQGRITDRFISADTIASCCVIPEENHIGSLFRYSDFGPCNLRYQAGC